MGRSGTGPGAEEYVILKLQGVDTPEAAGRLVGKILYIDRDQVELEEGTYFVADLIGLKVVDADDPEKVYGTLTQVSSTGANDVYRHPLPQWQDLLYPGNPPGG